MPFSSLGLPYSSLDVSSFSAWALGLIWNGLGFAKSFSPTITPQNPTVRLLERRWGFWCPRGPLTACQVLSSVNGRAFLFAQDTFLALRYTEWVFIKFWQLCAPHVGRRDGNPTVGISPVFTGTKNHAVTLIRGYKYPFELNCHFTFASKSSCAYSLNLVKCPVELTPSFNIKSLLEEFFLTSVSFIFSLTYTFSFLSLFLSCHFLSFTLLWVFS